MRISNFSDNTAGSASKVTVSSKDKKSFSVTNDTEMNLGSTKSSSKTEKKDDFKDVLKSKNKSLNNDISKSDDKAAVDENVDIDEEVKDVEEKIDKSSPDEIIEMLNSIMDILKEMQESGKLSLDDGSENNNLLKSVLDAINNNNVEEKLTDSNNLNDLISQLDELVNNDAIMSKMDSTTSSFIEKLLVKLTDSTNDTKLSDNLKNLLNNLKNSTEQNKTEKALSLEEMLNSAASAEENSNNTEESMKDDDFGEQKSNSKDADFLNKFLNKDKTDNKINMFAFRNTLAQNGVSNTTNSVTDVNKVSLGKDLIQDIRYMVTNSIKELTVKVNPGNLGQITIKIAEEDGVMKAVLKANSKETTQLIAQNIAEIKKSLDEQHIKVADVNVELYQEDTTFFKDGEFKEEMQKQDNHMLKGTEKIDKASLESEENENNKEADNNNVNFLA